MSLPLDPDAVVLAAEFPEWEIWQSLDGAWHARLRGAEKPVMVHGGDLGMLRDQIVGWLWNRDYQQQRQDQEGENSG